MALPSIKKVYFEITNICNLDCAFCPGTKRRKGFVILGDFRRVAKKLSGKIPYLYLHLMGEPTLHPQLPEILDTANEYGFKVIITTNGTTLGEKGDLLLKQGQVHKVSISLHSFEANGKSGVNMENYLDNCFSFARKAAEAGTVCVLRLWNLDGKETVGQNERNDDILTRMRQYFGRGWTKTRSGMRLCDRVFLEFDEKFEWPDAERIGESEEPRDFFCHGLRDQIGILCDGTVVPCCLDSEGSMPFGNIFECEYEDIIGSPQVKKFYDTVSARKCPSPVCATCGYATRFSNFAAKSY